jgi:hypothetical protein
MRNSKSGFVLGLMAVLFVASSVWAQDSLNVRRLGQVIPWLPDYEVALYSHYAYTCDTDYEIHIIDVSTPGDLSVTGLHLDGRVHAVAISGDYLYAIANGSLFVYSLTGHPAAPVLSGSVTIPHDVGDLVIDGSYAYVPGLAGLQIFNVSNPATPTLAADFAVPGYPEFVAVQGSYAYLIGGSADSTGLAILNVSTPSTPQLVSYYPLTGNSSAIALYGNYALLGRGYGGLQIIDVSNPAGPPSVYAASPSLITCFAVTGHYVYTGKFNDGVQVLDLSQPTSPQDIGFYDTPGCVVDLQAVGSLVYVADLPFFGIYDCSTIESVGRVSVAIPDNSGMEDCFPNPFNPTTQIRYRIAKTGPVELKVFDLNGREVETLVDFHQNPGEYEVQFDGTHLASGTYFAQLKASDFMQTQKLVLLK